MNIIGRDDLLVGLRKIQRTLCSYDIYPDPDIDIPKETHAPTTICDCKYGASRVGGKSEVGCGCPEVRAAIEIIEGLNKAEYRRLVMQSARRSVRKRMKR